MAIGVGAGFRCRTSPSDVWNREDAGGYFASSVSQRFDVRTPIVTFILEFFSFIFSTVLLLGAGPGAAGQAMIFNPSKPAFWAVKCRCGTAPVPHIGKTEGAA